MRGDTDAGCISGSAGRAEVVISRGGESSRDCGGEHPGWYNYKHVKYIADLSRRRFAFSPYCQEYSTLNSQHLPPTGPHLFVWGSLFL